MGDETSDVRFCSRVDCKDESGEQREAKWFVVLLLVPHRGYAGPPWRLQTNAVVCDHHRDRMADSFVTEALWKQVVELAKSRGREPPHRTSTRADFIPIPGTTAVQ